MMESDEDDISESQKGEENTRKRKITTKTQDKGEKSTSIGSPESRVFILVALARVNASNWFNIMTLNYIKPIARVYTRECHENKNTRFWATYGTSSIIEMSGHCCRNFQSGYPKRFWFRIFVDNRIIFESINYTVVCFADFQTTLVNEKI